MGPDPACGASPEIVRNWLLPPRPTLAGCPTRHAHRRRRALSNRTLGLHSPHSVGRSECHCHWAGPPSSRRRHRHRRKAHNLSRWTCWAPPHLTAPSLQQWLWASKDRRWGCKEAPQPVAVTTMLRPLPTWPQLSNLILQLQPTHGTSSHLLPTPRQPWRTGRMGSPHPQEAAETPLPALPRVQPRSYPMHTAPMHLGAMQPGYPTPFLARPCPPLHLPRPTGSEVAGKHCLHAAAAGAGGAGVEGPATGSV